MYIVAKSHCMLHMTGHESSLLTHLATLIAPTNLFFPSIYYNYAAHKSHLFCCLVSSVFHYNTNLSIQYHACLVAMLARWNGFLTGKYRLTSHLLI